MRNRITDRGDGNEEKVLFVVFLGGRDINKLKRSFQSDIGVL